MTTAPGEHIVEVDAFEGQPKRRIDLANPAPFGYSIAATLGLVALVDRADSAMVGGLLIPLQEEFGFNDAVAGILLSAPSVAALLLVVPAGRLADTRSRKMVLSIVILAWGLLTFGAAAAPTFALFFLARVLLGVATPLNIPASASMVGDLYRSEARTKAFAIVRVMEYLGFPVGVAVGGIVGAIFGWRVAFLVMGIPAILLAAYIAVKLREPKRGLADELTVEAERAGIPVVAADADPHAGFDDVPEAGEPIDARHSQDPEQQGKLLDRIKEVLRIRTLRNIIIGQALLFAGFSGMFSFAPTFFERVHDLNEGAGAAIAGGIGLVGLLVGGVLASRIGDRYHGVRPGWRIYISAICMTIASVFVLIMAAVPILPLQIALYVVINITNIVALANLGAAQADVIPARLRGTGFATAQFLVTIGSSFGAVIVGTVSNFVIGRETDITQQQVSDLKKASTDATKELDKAKDSGAPQSVIDGLQATADAAEAAYDKLYDLFQPAAGIGIQWGVGSLFVVLIIGALLMFRARPTYEEDAAAVIAEKQAAQDA